MAPSTRKSRRSSSKSTSARKSSSSSRSPREVKAGGDIADNRAAAGHKNQGVQGGFVDQMTRRSASDALEGHFVTIDRTHAGLSKEAKELLGGRDGYGVYTEPAEVDSGGFPKTAVVILRDSSNARVVVPYDALAPADANRRS
jgi:hypothetical protein